ncbi:winged helix DNA-binding domain-containing protein [Kutzneria sp. NPDC052558]|uniref:winged helix DNA-binding domain-containing protein n=1 Tax=Kutzneria sp. NPDC052558 TaxID=3364121 RepID=UPI0037C9CA95
MTVLTRRALNRALLHRQLLLRRWNLTPAKAIERLVGLQAQATTPPYFALWTRLDGFHRDQLTRLLTGRRVVRLAMMRSTLHLVTADDCLAVRPVLQPMLEQAFARTVHGHATQGLDLDKIARVARELIEAEPLTNTDLTRALSERWPDRDATALLQVVRARLAIVQLPPRGVWGVGGQPTGTTAESWLGRPFAPITVDDLVLRYLAAFGPASVQDAQTWSGLTRLREVFERLPLKAFTDEDGVELFDIPAGRRPDPDTPAPVRFLPEFDNSLLSHADRRRIIAAEHRRHVFTNNGIIRGTVLVDGFVAATWKLAPSALTVTPLVPIADRDEIEAEAQRLTAFAGEPAAIRMLPSP